MIYSQLVDMIGHRRKDMSFLSFFFFLEGRKEIGGQRWYSRWLSR